MSIYRVAQGHDVALIDLDPIDPQPRSEGVRPTSRVFAASGVIHEQGLFVELEFTVVDGVTAYQALLTQFGLNALNYGFVTIYVRDDRFAWTRYNGTAIRPEPDKEVKWNYFPRNVVILVRDLEAA